MKIKCAICDKQFSSLVIDFDIAWGQVYEQVMRHAMHKHQSEFYRVKAEIDTAAKALALFLTVGELVEFNEQDEPRLAAEIEKTQEVIMIAAGFEPTNGTDDEDEVLEDVEVEDDEDDTSVIELEPVPEDPATPRDEESDNPQTAKAS